MTFLNPWLLGGAAAIAAPIIIHLMRHWQVRRVPWAAMRFLQQVVVRNQRRLRLEDRLLLALRCVLLILLALALARPAFHTSGLAAGGGSQMAVILIDHSCSMALTDGVASRFDNARQAATQILQNLPAGSTAALLAFSDIVQPLIPEPTADLALARKTIADLTLTSRATDVLPAVRAALALFARHASERKQLYLITDGQASAWRQLPAIRQEVAAAGARPQLILVGPPPLPNLTVSQLALASAFVPVGEAARFTASVTNNGSEEVRNVPVSLGIEAEPPGDQAVIDAIPPGASKSLSLFAKFRAPGWHSVTARLPPDHLPVDDRRTIMVHARQGIRVLIVQGDAGGAPRESDAFFLTHALAPGAAGEGESAFIKPQVISATELDSVELDGFDAVILANVPAISPAAVQALTAYLRHGGGLLFFPGEKTDPAFWNGAFGPKLGAFPAVLGPPRGEMEKRDHPFPLQAGGYTHPLVSIWQDSAAGTLGAIRIFKYLPLTPLPAAGSEAGPPVTILSFADGSPALMERDWARGRVLLFATTANTRWNDLPTHPSFVPLIQRAVGRLVARGDQQLNIAVGAPLIRPVSPGLLNLEATITTPGGPARRRVALLQGEPVLKFEETDVAGVYGAAIPADPPVAFRFAVQGDPAESNLTPLPEADLASFGRGTPVVRWAAGADLRQTMRDAASGRELWSLFADLALAAAVAETLLASHFSLSK